MVRVLPQEDGADERLVLSLLNSVDDGATSQRHIAAELGIALGLVNAYLKRCVKKGLVKVRQVPSRRYAYFLTPQGFTEKSRLTVEYLSSSFSFFRSAKADCAEVYALARSRNFQNLVLLGKSDLAEIAIISAVENDVTIVAIVDRDTDSTSFIGKNVLASFDNIDFDVDAVVVTDVVSARATMDEALSRFGAHRVFAPKLLGLGSSRIQEVDDD